MESPTDTFTGAPWLRFDRVRMVATIALLIITMCLPGLLRGQSGTGGTVTFSGGQEIHIFTSSGSFSLNGSNAVSAQVLLVAGGGGAGAGSVNNWGGGGGGAGG